MFLDQKRFRIRQSSWNGQQTVGDRAIDEDFLRLAGEFRIADVHNQGASAIGGANVLQCETSAVVELEEASPGAIGGGIASGCHNLLFTDAGNAFDERLSRRMVQGDGRCKRTGFGTARFQKKTHGAARFSFKTLRVFGRNKKRTYRKNGEQ